jgi:hypothetical protein
MTECVRAFGVRGIFFYYLIKLPLRLLYVHVTMCLDNVFFPAHRKEEIKTPVFIIGHPRSASSFLHHILTETGDFLAFKNWEVHSPALVVRGLLERFTLARLCFTGISDLRYTPRAVWRETSAHPGGLKGMHAQQRKNLQIVAQEEELLFLNVLDTQFIALDTPIGFSQKGFPELVYNDDQPHQERSVQFFKRCLQRQSYRTKRGQLLAKMNFSIFRIKTLRKVFPDARFVILVRSPLETIHSHLSLQYNALDRMIGIENIPEDKLRQFMDNRYQYNVEFYERLMHLLGGDELPPESFIEVRYEQIKEHLRETIERIAAFSNIEMSPELSARIDDYEAKQASYKRAHVNLPLEKFGLTEQKLREDMSCYFERYPV